MGKKIKKIKYFFLDFFFIFSSPVSIVIIGFTGFISAGIASLFCLVLPAYFQGW